MKRIVIAALLVVLGIGMTGGGMAIAQPPKVLNPDLTRGEPVPDGWVHDWNLGATGARGWMYCDRLTTTDARQILVTHVEKGSPAAGRLEVGDVILGVAGARFSSDPRTELGRALSRAESEAGGGRLALSRWRSGSIEEVVLALPVLGSYAATAPYDCAKSRRILEQGCRALARRMAETPSRSNPIPRCLNALALLSSGNPDYLPLVSREARWAAEFSSDGFQTWYYGYAIILLAEYVMATGDRAVMPGLRRLALDAAEGQSMVGSWGHRFALPDGRLGGYGMMNSPGVPLTVGLVLAREAGVKHRNLDRAIERSLRLLRFYIGKGAIPYGDHDPWLETHEDNGKCGMAGVLFDLLGETEGATFFSRMSLASHGSERDCGHTGNFFNLLWAMPAIARAGPVASGAWMKEFGASSFDLARRSDGGFAHQGPPEPAKDKYAGFDATGAFLLGYAMPLRKLRITGRGPRVVPELDAAAAESVLADGRGWTNKDRTSAYDALDTPELLGRLGSWSPVVRGRAATALARRKAEVVPALMELLASPRPACRLGACEALEALKGAAAPAVDALATCLQKPDLWLRIQAAEALAAVGDPAMRVVPELLQRLTLPPSEADPRGMEQRYLCFSLFDPRRGLLRRSLKGVDRDLLRNAVAAGLKNEDGRARGALGSVYDKLSYEEIRPLLPAIHDAIVESAPSGIMFASGIRLAGLDLLAKHRIREGLPLCLDVMELDKWGKQDRVKRCLAALDAYGAAARPLLPRLRDLEQGLLAHTEAKSLAPHVEQLRKLIEKLEKETGTVELRDLR